MTVRPLSEADREMLLDAVAGGYLHGRCYAMALALHRRTGWPLIAAVDSRGRMVHAGVRHPDGRPFDVRGPVSEEAFAAAYLSNTVADVTEEALAAADGPFLPERIARADRLLDDLFPELPASNKAHRLDVFLDALHRLCTEHGFYIRAAVPGAPPVVYERYGDECGFIADRLAVGGWTFDRRLTNGDGPNQGGS